jgi:hypothetical protein
MKPISLLFFIVFAMPTQANEARNADFAEISSTDPMPALWAKTEMPAAWRAIPT